MLDAFIKIFLLSETISREILYTKEIDKKITNALTGSNIDVPDFLELEDKAGRRQIYNTALSRLVEFPLHAQDQDD